MHLTTGTTDRFHDNCFTLLRNVLALCVFFVHAIVLTDTDCSMLNPRVYVSGFFIISGFLTWHSYARNDGLRDFAVNRCRRIYPPYAMAIAFCLLVGMLLTRLPLTDFLTSSQTLCYVGSNLVFLNFLQPALPGVFETNVVHVMNGSLWTMKVEVLFYCSVPIVAWLARRYGHNVVLCSLVAASLVYTATLGELFRLTGMPFFATLAHLFPAEIATLYMPAAMLGLREWVCRHRLPIMLVALPLCWACLSHDRLLFALPLFLTPVILIMAYSFRCRFHDLSYEFFLLHFPILQIYIHYGITSLPILLPLAFLTTCLLASALNAATRHCRKVG